MASLAIRGPGWEVPMSGTRTKLAFTALALAAAVFAPATQAVTITRGFAGLWHDTNAKRGFSAEIVDAASGKQLVAYWITTDAAGKPMWVIGQGPIVGNRAVLAAVVGNSATASSGTQSWGQITVAFSDCAHGTVTFAPTDSRQQRGQTTIARLSPDGGKSCTGGISDDHGGADVRIVQFFTNTGAAPAASGKARFEARSDRSDFKVEAEDLPIGDYSLRVAGAEKATLTVATSANGTEGEVEFRSPVEPGKILLDFDPRGQRVEIAQGDTVFLTTKLGTESGGGDNGGGTGGAVDRYELRVEAQHDGPEFKAVLDSRTLGSEFRVELEDVAVGSYTLNVGGTDRGTIDVVAVEGGTEGEVEFRDPPEPDHLPLDFDPRGQLVQILDNGSVVLSGTFPTQPTGAGGGGGDDGGGGGNGGGGDDGGGDDNGGGSGGGGNDDPPGDDNGGGSGNDDPPGDDHGGGGNGGGHGRH